MKKILALVLAFAMVVTLSAAFVSAEDEDNAIAIKSISFKSEVDGVVNAVPRGSSTSIDVLIDGDTVSDANDHQITGIVLFQNTHCETAEEYPNFDLILELEDTAVVNGGSISFYNQGIAMIGTPKDRLVTIEYSDDGVDYIYAEEIVLDCIDSNDDWEKNNGAIVNETVEFSLTTPVNAKYIKLTFAFGDSPWTDSKPVWEWMGMTEIALDAVEAGGPVVDDSSAPADESSSEETSAPVVSESKNLALGATVLNTPKYEAGGQWPASYTGNLTDGITGGRGDLGLNGVTWAAFYKNTSGENENDNFDGKVGEIVVDLGKKEDLTSFRTHIWGAADSGIAAMSKVEFLVSDDNENWTSVGAVTEGLENPDTCWAELTAEASGRYVKYVYTMTEESGKTGVFLFVSECEAYGKVASTEKPTDPTSDSGIVALAVIASLAVAGAVIVKKSR